MALADSAVEPPTVLLSPLRKRVVEIVSDPIT
jgi:hypothetical protein